MQVLFGADEMLGAAGMLRQAARAGKKGLNVGAKAIRATSGLAPAVAFIPGVGVPAAAGLIAAKKSLDLGAKARKVARPAAKTAAKTAKPAFTKGRPTAVISAPESIKKAMAKKSFLPKPGPIVIPGLPPIPGIPKPAPGPEAKAPQGDNFLKKNWPLLAGGAAVLFLLMGKRR